MEFILELLADHPYFQIVASVVALASAIAAVTPTPKKGSKIAKLYKLIDIAAINIGKAKENGEDEKGEEDPNA